MLLAKTNTALFALFFVIACVPTAASQQVGRTWNSQCMDDNGIDRCSAEVRERVLSQFSVLPIEQMQAEGATVRRAFLVNGHGGDMPLVSFERHPGHGPTLNVSALVPTGQDQHRVVRMSAEVTLDLWTEVINGSRNFDRILAPASDREPRDPAGCLHQWVATVEAADQSDGFAVRYEPNTRRRTQVACADGLAFDYAFTLANFAVQFLPHCRVIATRRQDGGPGALSICAMFDGDRIAAAEAWNQYTELPFVGVDTITAASVALVFHESIEVTRSGAPVARGFQEAAVQWPRIFDRRYFIPTRVFGLDADQVRIEGFIRSIASEDPWQWRIEPAVQTWVRENGFDFRLTRLVIEAETIVSRDGPE